MKNENVVLVIRVFIIPAIITLLILAFTSTRPEPYPEERYLQLESAATDFVTSSGIDYSLLDENEDLWYKKYSHPDEKKFYLEYGYNNSLYDDYRSIWVKLTISKDHYDIVDSERHLSKKNYESSQFSLLIIDAFVIYIVAFFVNIILQMLIEALFSDD